MRIMVLAGGPDREREVSEKSGASVAAALKAAGHEVMVEDIRPRQLGALDRFRQWRGDVVFPVLHGSWGEGGPLQMILAAFGIPFVGCWPATARLCMDKTRTKHAFERLNLPTPAYETLTDAAVEAGQPRGFDLPAVIKPPQEGSSIDLAICHDPATFRTRGAELARRHDALLVEQFVAGHEMTIGVIQVGDEPLALPAIHIVPGTEFYDYEAKYTRNDTQYRFELPADGPTQAELADLAIRVFQGLSIRHLCRVDVMVKPATAGQPAVPYLLEVNTIPGFTDHSLLPKAAAEAGLPMPELVDALVRRALEDAHAPAAGEDAALSAG